MVYPVELAAGAVMLVVGYLLHYNHPLVDRYVRRTNAAGTPFASGDIGSGRRSVVMEQVAGATLLLLGLVLVLDGLGL